MATDRATIDPPDRQRRRVLGRQPRRPVVLARDGRLDYLTLEYLAELTMSILAHLRSKDPNAGYVTDFLDLLDRLAPILREQDGLRIVTNAGGMNPPACAAACGAILERAGLGDCRSASSPATTCSPHPATGSATGVDLDHLETGEPIAAVADRLVSANAYLGARPIAEALEQGARIVLTGRVADASLTLGPALAALRLGLGRLAEAGRRRPSPGT